MKIWLASGAASIVMMTGLAAPAFADETQAYTYDALSRLIVVDYSGTINNNQAHSLGYDAAGNRTRYRSSSTGVFASCFSAMMMSGEGELVAAGDGLSGSGPESGSQIEDAPAGETLPDVPPVADDGPAGVNPVDGPLPPAPPPGNDEPPAELPEGEGPGQ